MKCIYLSIPLLLSLLIMSNGSEAKSNSYTIAYSSHDSGHAEIYLTNPEAKSKNKITNFPGGNGYSAWSPDGKSIAFYAKYDQRKTWSIHTMNSDGTNRKRLTHADSKWDNSPTWSPDGSSILFTSDRAGRPQIYKIELASRALTRLTFKGSYNSRGRLTQDGRFLTMVHQDSTGYHIAVQDLVSGRLDVLTNSRDDESPTIAPNGVVVMYATKKAGRGVLAGVSLDGKIKFTMPSDLGEVREPAWSPFLN